MSLIIVVLLYELQSFVSDPAKLNMGFDCVFNFTSSSFPSFFHSQNCGQKHFPPIFFSLSRCLRFFVSFLGVLFEENRERVGERKNRPISVQINFSHDFGECKETKLERADFFVSSLKCSLFRRV